MSPLYLRVRELRTAKGLSQAQLAERAKIRIATISEIENQKTRRVDFDVLERLAEALDVDPSFLLTRTSARRK